jgi:hypothetical protein
MKESVKQWFKKWKNCTLCMAMTLGLVLVPVVFGTLLAAWSAV